VWIGKEGLALFSRKKEEQNVTRENLGDGDIYQVNYPVNKKSKECVGSVDVNEDERGNKSRVRSVLKLLKRKGHNVEVLWEEITDGIEKSMIAIHPPLLN
jgi:hypothetical protein